MGKTIFYVPILFSVLFFMFPASGSEELFEEYETLLTRVTGNYEGALRAPDSRAGKDYQKTLQNFIRVSRKLQSAASPGGADYNFENLARSVERLFFKTEQFLRYEKGGGSKHYLGDKPFDREKKRGKKYLERERVKEDRNRSRNRNSNTKRSSGNRKANERSSFLKENNPLPVFNILANDLKNLRKSGLNVKTNPFQKTLNEYSRLVNFYKGNYLDYLLRINSECFKQEFKRRGELFLRTAQNIMRMHSGKNAGDLPYNLAQETAIILRVTGFYTSGFAKESVKGREVYSAHNRQEANTSFDRINRTVLYLSKDLNIALEHSSGKSTLLQSAGLEKSGEINVDNLSDKELRTKLLQIRKKIFDGNTLINGIDKNTLRKFKVTLTKKEQTLFTKIRKNYANNGYDPEAADRYSCVYILNNPEKSYGRSEASRILARLAKELEKENKKKME